ncbi:gamma-glutamylcyclotransferase [Bradyrhizobium sp. 139]|nr:gamma-glutamylcyclotransferase [Bradyrhizobium sp. 139]
MMLALDSGGTAAGMAFRLPSGAVAEEISLLWPREMAVGSYAARWLRAKCVEGDIRVLAFVANKRAANYVTGLSEAESARMIVNASGFLGTNLEYLLRTSASLSEHGIKDALVERLVRLCGDPAACAGPSTPFLPIPL